MIDTYKGESPAKKLARISVWEMIAAGRSRPMGDARYLVLASREGGDINFLLGTGIKPTQIFAADINKAACAMARERFPGVTVLEGDVVDYARDKKLPNFDAIFLDFCGPVCESTLTAFHEVILWKATQDSVAVLGVMRGREQSEFAQECAQQKRVRVEWMETGRLDPELGDNSRGDVMTRWLLDKSMGLGLPYLALPYGAVHYHSRTELAGGVPMFMKGYRVARNWPRRSRSAFIESAQKKWHTLRRAFDVDGGIRTVMISGQDNDEKVRKILLDVAASMSLQHPEMIMNVSKATLAAWKAHATRGTYARTA